MRLYFAPSRKLAAHRREHGGHRVYDPRERVVLAAADGLLRVLSHPLGLRPAVATGAPSEARRILALRLDRIGDLVTTLPALEALRAAAPNAEIELGVGSWNEPIARRLPFVDRVRVVDTPWASWDRPVGFAEARRALAGEPFDLALDFQGDVRVLVLMALAKARLRGGYGETGGRYLLTHRARWDETKSWYWQNMELVRALFPDGAPSSAEPVRPYNFLVAEDREQAAALAERSGLLRSRRPLIGIQPSAGRALKQWEASKFALLIGRLAATGTVVVTGAEADRELVERIVSESHAEPSVLLGVELGTYAALIERLDVFVTGDTGPMHLCHAVGTPNVAIFGPSDPMRYGPDEVLGLRHVVRRPVYCSPCNMIRRPPAECARAPVPECIDGIGVDDVLTAVEAATAAGRRD